MQQFFLNFSEGEATPSRLSPGAAADIGGRENCSSPRRAPERWAYHIPRKAPPPAHKLSKNSEKPR